MDRPYAYIKEYHATAFDLEKIMDGLADILTTVLFFCFLRFDGFAGGGKYLILLSVSIFLLKTRGHFRISADPFVLFLPAMILFTALSSLWAWNPGQTRLTTMYMVRSFLYYALVYFAYAGRENSTHKLLRAIKWAAYLETVFQIRYYGINGLMDMLLEGRRAANGATGNVNGIGMTIAWGCVYEIIEIAHGKKLKLSSLMLIPSLLVIAATQSRKALLIIFIAVAFVACLYYIDWRNAGKALAGILISVFTLLIMYVIIKNVPVFAGIYTRLESIINVLGGEEMDESLVGRQKLIEWGWEQFLKTPILGIGMDNGRELVYIMSNGTEYVYLHNNFIEILCGGGIIGFLIYYSRFVYLYYILYRYRDKNSLDYYSCLIVATIYLAMDYGRICFHERQSQSYFILLFLQLAGLRNCNKAKDAELAQCRYLKN